MQTCTMTNLQNRFWLFTIPLFAYSLMAGLVATADSLSDIESFRLSHLSGQPEQMESHVFDSLTGTQAEWPLYGDNGEVDIEAFNNLLAPANGSGMSKLVSVAAAIDQELAEPFMQSSQNFKGFRPRFPASSAGNGFSD